MSDERLRELERRWRESSAVDDEAAYLRERVRVGDLEQRRLELAALCGDPAARALTKIEPYKRRDTWCNEVAAFGREPVERSALAVGRLVLPCWTDLFPEDLRLERALRDVEQHLAGRACGDFLSIGGARHDAARRDPDGYASPACRAAWTVEYAYGLVLSARDDDVTHLLRIVLECACERWKAAPYDRWQLVLGAIRSDVVPWALGYADPVRARVATRGDL